MDILDLDRRALAAAGRAVALVSADQLISPTPCRDWTLADLLAHMVAHNHGFAAAASGTAAPESAWAQTPVGADPYPAYLESATLVSSAFAAEGALGRQIELPGLGVFPARLAISFHFVDYLIHAWDVAKAIGAAGDPDDELAGAALSMASRWPDSPAIRGPGAPFGPRVDVPPAAAPLHRLLGLLGRPPTWPGPASPA